MSTKQAALIPIAVPLRTREVCAAEAPAPVCAPAPVAAPVPTTGTLVTTTPVDLVGGTAVVTGPTKEAIIAQEPKAACAPRRSNAGRYIAIWLISSLVFFLLFLLLRPNYFMNTPSAEALARGATATYNWGRLVIAALLAGAVITLLAWAASRIGCRS